MRACETVGDPRLFQWRADLASSLASAAARTAFTANKCGVEIRLALGSGTGSVSTPKQILGTVGASVCGETIDFGYCWPGGFDSDGACVDADTEMAGMDADATLGCSNDDVGTAGMDAAVVSSDDNAETVGMDMGAPVVDGDDYAGTVGVDAGATAVIGDDDTEMTSLTVGATMGSTIEMLVRKCGMVAGARSSIVGHNRTQWKLGNGRSVQRDQENEAWKVVPTKATPNMDQFVLAPHEGSRFEGQQHKIEGMSDCGTECETGRPRPSRNRVQSVRRTIRACCRRERCSGLDARLCAIAQAPPALLPVESS